MEKINIIEELIKGTPQGKGFIESLYDNSFEKWMLAGSGFIVILFMIMYSIDVTRKYSLILFLVFIILILLYLISTVFISPWKTFKNPTREWLSNTSEILERQNSLIHRLSTYSTWDIENTLFRINRDLEKIKNRIGFLIGAFDKLGIIPILFGLYMTMTEVFEPLKGEGLIQEVLHYDITLYITAFVIGLYMGVFYIARVIENYEEFKIALIQAQKLATQREALNNKRAPSNN